jgi:hypothetical protein
MGASNYTNYARAKSMREAYRNLVEEANDEYGHQQGYSGEINCSQGFVDKTAAWKASKLKLEDYINKNCDGGGKGDEAWGICYKAPVANTNKVKSVVEHSVFKGTRKWELLYIPSTPSESWVGKSFDNKAEAVAAARKHTEETGESTVVHIERRLSRDSGSSRVASIKYKSSPKEDRGSYVFFGLAPC